MLRNRINEIIKKVTLFGGSIDSNLKLKEDLGIDSLRIVELIVRIENDFSVSFDFSDLDTNRFHTVSDLYELVEKYVV